MFTFLKSMFSSNKIPSTSFYTLYNKILYWKESKVYPNSYSLPEAISFSEDFWKDVVRIYRETLKDGHERAISVFWVDGDLILTSVVKGNESSVSSNHSVNVKYIAHPTKKEYLRKQVLLDGKTIKKKDVYYKKVPKKVVVQYIFNMHTHPKHENGYGYFSKQDIVSMVSSEAVLTGLVTDKLWLLIRTKDTPNVVNMEDMDITVESLKSAMNMNVYCAEFYKNAIKQ